MDKYKTGTVFELHQNKEYMIIDSIKKENSIYALAAPIYNNGENVTANYSKTLLVKIDKDTDEMTIETNENIIEEIVNGSINKLK